MDRLSLFLLLVLTLTSDYAVSSLPTPRRFASPAFPSLPDRGASYPNLPPLQPHLRGGQEVAPAQPSDSSESQLLDDASSSSESSVSPSPPPLPPPPPPPPPPPLSPSHKMSPLISFANILADLSPHGMLPLAYGLASTPGATGSGAAALILGSFGALGWYSLHSISRAKAISSVDDSDSLQSVHDSLGLPPSRLPTIMPLCLTLGCCLFYQAFLGDIFTPLFAQTGLGKRVKRSWVILSLSGLVLLPLCLQEDLSALQVRNRKEREREGGREGGREIGGGEREIYILETIVMHTCTRWFYLIVSPPTNTSFISPPPLPPFYIALLLDCFLFLFLLLLLLILLLLLLFCFPPKRFPLYRAFLASCTLCASSSTAP